MNRSTLRSSFPKGAHPSLFPLRMVLFAAERETPTQPPRKPRDPDEMLAVRLIDRIKKCRQVSPAAFPVEPLQADRSAPILELADAHA